MRGAGAGAGVGVGEERVRVQVCIIAHPHPLLTLTLLTLTLSSPSPQPHPLLSLSSPSSFPYRHCPSASGRRRRRYATLGRSIHTSCWMLPTLQRSAKPSSRGPASGSGAVRRFGRELPHPLRDIVTLTLTLVLVTLVAHLIAKETTPLLILAPISTPTSAASCGRTGTATCTQQWG